MAEVKVVWVGVDVVLGFCRWRKAALVWTVLWAVNEGEAWEKHSQGQPVPVRWGCCVELLRNVDFQKQIMVLSISVLCPRRLHLWKSHLLPCRVHPFYGFGSKAQEQHLTQSCSKWTSMLSDSWTFQRPSSPSGSLRKAPASEEQTCGFARAKEVI